LGTAPHAAHFATVTRAAWLPQTVTNGQFAGFGIQLEGWLRKQYRDNTPADRTVRALLEVPYQVNRPNGAPMGFVQATGSDPDRNAIIGFFQANESKAENVAAAVSRLFLGVKLECAQCHDHPFAPYTKEQFWEFAAFFADLNRTPTNRPSEPAPTGPQATRNRIALPNSDKVVVAKFFDGTSPEWNEVMSPRQELAEWLTDRDNPYFARNLANRTWAHFFGVGIVDPVDEPGENNPPSHPDLLADLGRAFAASGYDNRLLIRAVTRTKAYQLSSRLSHPTQADPRRFARMNLKGLTPSQLFDSLVSATGYREPAGFRQAFPGFVQPNNPRSVFLNRFASTDRPTESSTTILQALMLMNGDFLDAQTAPDRAEILGAVADIPGWDNRRRVETLYLAALSRRPSGDELDRFSSYVDRSTDKKKALGDVFWVLLNSPEFLFNH
ncbi:MAG TPA: DUF1553 domain-containing protein, partial [Urbifossiella sp.]|nr:DUF1553 domain-containing protein [Urbifossiella sp.]